MDISTIPQPRPSAAASVTSATPRTSADGSQDNRRLKADTIEISSQGKAMLEKSPACPTCGSAGCAGC